MEESQLLLSKPYLTSAVILVKEKYLETSFMFTSLNLLAATHPINPFLFKIKLWVIEALQVDKSTYKNFQHKNCRKVNIPPMYIPTS